MLSQKQKIMLAIRARLGKKKESGVTQPAENPLFGKQPEFPTPSSTPGTKIPLSKPIFDQGEKATTPKFFNLRKKLKKF